VCLRGFSFDILHDITDYTEGAELVDAVLDVVRKEAEGTDCLQGKLACFLFSGHLLILSF